MDTDALKAQARLVARLYAKEAIGPIKITLENRHFLVSGETVTEIEDAAPKPKDVETP